ncbi:MULTISPECIES: hypothetical protein [Aphanizomenon]|jgi:hypothetical protein|uniref:hypothetical protein n=1 Tax=Aphanizomenon TaxID=1175 RepID=UPI000A5FCF57|nr:MULTISPECIES: hypothetical protein [Aphanizomenon]MBO1069781.1 hypothetical protein [Dolichospermum sp. DEX189]QSV72206.1 MAG: hypothetical protein HEQ20_17480 [Aphanizomenon flos-aquae KM1D3_PB]
MISQQIEDQSQQLESRVATLETESNKTPWWLKIAGSFENDPHFEEVVKLGQEWRNSAE